MIIKQLDNGDIENINEVFADLVLQRKNLRGNRMNAPSGGINGPSSAAINRAMKDAGIEMASDDTDIIFNAFTFEDKHGSLELNVGHDHVESKDNKVFSWVAPTCVKVLAASPIDPCGVTSKTHFKLEKGRNHVLSATVEIWDETLAGVLEKKASAHESEAGQNRADAIENVLAIRDAKLQEDLSAARTTGIRDIVKSLQPSQVKLIQQPYNEPLRIQGGPGCGKTVVALHRLQYILHQDSEVNPKPKRVLVVGPTESYSNHMRSFVTRINPKSTTIDVRPSSYLIEKEWTWKAGVDSERQQVIKRQDTTFDLVAKALFNEIRVPTDNIELAGATIAVSEIVNWVGDVKRMNTYNQGRQSFLQTAERSLKEIGLKPAIVKGLIRKIGKDIWPAQKPGTFLRRLLASSDRLLDAAHPSMGAGDLQEIRRKDIKTEYFFSEADLNLLDYLEVLINGAKPYDFVLVDEAQDLTIGQCQVLAHLVKGGAITVVGDQAQSVFDDCAGSWSFLCNLLIPIPSKWQAVELTNTYRLPPSVTEFLNEENLPGLIDAQLSPLISVKQESGEFDQWIDRTDAINLFEIISDVIERHVSRWSVDERRTLAVIADSSEFEFVNEGMNAIGWEGVTFTPLQAKGLEFDTVIVVHPVVISQNPRRGLEKLFVSYSRASEALYLVGAALSD